MQALLDFKSRLAQERTAGATVTSKSCSKSHSLTRVYGSIIRPYSEDFMPSSQTSQMVVLLIKSKCALVMAKFKISGSCVGCKGVSGCVKCN